MKIDFISADKQLAGYGRPAAHNHAMLDLPRGTSIGAIASARRIVTGLAVDLISAMRVRNSKITK